MNLQRHILLSATMSLLAVVSGAQILRHTGTELFVLNNGRQINHIHSSSTERHLSFSFGYGFPNVDQSYLPSFYYFAQGHISQKGPFTGSFNYHPNNKMSLGLLLTYGTVSAKYHSDNSSSMIQNLHTKFGNGSMLFSFNRYMNVSKKITTYTRLSVGVNFWKQDYTDEEGKNAEISPADLPVLAYQAAVGAKFKLLGASSLFLEAGYGKYILHTGVSFDLR